MANLDTAPAGIDIDSLHKPETTARWLGVSKRTLLRGARKGKIPVVRLNERTLRFHPRSILAALQ
jgi:predicted site-specific integrase-resolvase